MSGITAILPAFNEEVAERAGAEVIRHPKNRGKSVALKTGFAALNRMIAIVMGPELASKRNLL